MAMPGADPILLLPTPRRMAVLAGRADVPAEMADKVASWALRVPIPSDAAEARGWLAIDPRDARIKGEEAYRLAVRPWTAGVSR